MQCKACKCPLDAAGCDDAEKHDTDYPDHCRGCAAQLHDEAEYKEHLARGGAEYEAWLLDEQGRRLRRFA